MQRKKPPHFSRRSGVPIRTLESWSRRINIPRDVYQLYKVAQALGCHIEDLIEPEVAEKASAAKAAADGAAADVFTPAT